MDTSRNMYRESNVVIGICISKVETVAYYQVLKVMIFYEHCVDSSGIACNRFSKECVTEREKKIIIVIDIRCSSD